MRQIAVTGLEEVTPLGDDAHSTWHAALGVGGSSQRARAKKLGLWRACPRTIYNPYEAIATRR